ncbi:stage II sporulation protein D [Thermus composti]|uniref:SpoIID/LytB domain-containing protein n=1 Tax=Thermus composti TaxID=532059 RepID=A0ABV6Q563_9DEIN|nr:SpoIID/LytB domain-containing protein [Thermus composti]GGN04168.1 stage II sporulation protein D [Thermus composti]
MGRLGLAILLGLVFLGLFPGRGQVGDLVLRVLLKEVSAGEAVRLSLPQGEVRAWLGEGGVVVEGKAFPYLDLEGPYFSLEGRSYRGGVRLWPEGERLWVINRVALEDYLLGVVPAEMPDGFPLEALKAQAVVARTFAVRRYAPGAPYDLCADERCQVYGGFSAEKPRAKTAVVATRGLVLSYGSEAISALYHADSGGMTAGSEEVFQKALPYLRPRPDPYARGPKSSWRMEVDPATARKALQALGYDPRGDGPPQVLKRSPSGRVWRVRLLGVEVEGPEAQRLMRLLGLPSALVDFQGWLASGRGAGHGVGLSQWGAKGMAEAGYGFREVLGYYFPGTGLSALVLEAQVP